MHKTKVKFSPFTILEDEIYLVDMNQIDDWCCEQQFYLEIYHQLVVNKIISETNQQNKASNFVLIYMLWLIRNQYGISLNDLMVSKNGKKYFKNHEIYFSISHSEKYCAFIVSKSPIGLDIQRINQVDYSIIVHNYSQMFGNCEKKKDFFKRWTMVEAYVKLTDQKLLDVLEKVPYSELINLNPVTKQFKKYMITYIKK